MKEEQLKLHPAQAQLAVCLAGTRAERALHDPADVPALTPIPHMHLRT